MIATIFLSIIFTTLSAWIDADHLNKYEYIKDHTSRSILRIFVFCLIGATIGNGMIEILVTAFLAAATFYLIFDILLNYLREGFVWNYIGGTATIDMFFRKHRKWWFPTKIILFTLAILLYIFIN